MIKFLSTRPYDHKYVENCREILKKKLEQKKELKSLLQTLDLEIKALTQTIDAEPLAEKKCNVCGVVRSVSCFSVQHSNKKRLRGTCKVCACQRARASYLKRRRA